MPGQGRRKKLIAAAQYLLKSGQQPKADRELEETLEDMRRFGAPEHVLEEYREAHEHKPEPFAVYPDNWEAVTLFRRSITQWVYAGMGQRVGLLYPGVESIARALRLEWTDDLLSRLQILESAYMEAARQ